MAMGEPSALELARRLPGAADDVFKAMDCAAYLMACGPVIPADLARLRAVQASLRALVVLAEQTLTAVAEQERDAELVVWEGRADAVVYD